MSGGGGQHSSSNMQSNKGIGASNVSSHALGDFKKGDVVWAKVRGYSWWPAKIGEVLGGAQAGSRQDKTERKYRVDFLGDNTHQTVAHDKVLDFIENYVKLSNTKKRDLLESIEIAKKQLRREELAALERIIAKEGGGSLGSGYSEGGGAGGANYSAKKSGGEGVTASGGASSGSKLKEDGPIMPSRNARAS